MAAAIGVQPGVAMSRRAGLIDARAGCAGTGVLHHQQAGRQAGRAQIGPLDLPPAGAAELELAGRRIAMPGDDSDYAVGPPRVSRRPLGPPALGSGGGVCPRPAAPPPPSDDDPQAPYPAET